MEEQRTIIEVNGVKLDVDLRQARRIDELKIGSEGEVFSKGLFWLSYLPWCCSWV